MSKRILTASVAVVGLLSFVTVPSRAQTVRVVDKPGDGEWTVSFSRKEGPSTFEIEAVRKTKAEALQVAERLRARSNSMSANSPLRLAVILMEGEDAAPPNAPRNSDVPAIRDPFQRLNDTINDLWKDTQETLKKVLEHSKQDVDSAVKRVKELRDYMVRNVDKLNDDNFKQINGLIDEYNGKVDKYKSEPGGEAFALYPRMNPITRQSMEKIKRWQQAKANQAQLAAGKKTLDGEKSRIDQEREALVQEGQSLRSEEARLQNLRQQATAGDGPFEVFIKGDVIIPGEYSSLNPGKRFNTYDEATAWLEKVGYGNSPNRYTIRDSTGNQVTSPPKKADAADLDKAENDVRQRQAEYKRRLQKYQQELLGGYNERVSTHQSKIQSHADDVKSLSQ